MRRVSMIKTKKNPYGFASLLLIFGLTTSTEAQTPQTYTDTTGSKQITLSLQECRDFALNNNYTLKIAKEEINKANYDKKTAFASYLPKVSVSGIYAYNSENISLINKDQENTLRNLGTATSNEITKLMTQMSTDPVMINMLQNSTTMQSLFAKMKSGEISSSVGAFGNEMADNLTLDTRNVFAGIVSVQEPLFLGGKIMAYNQIAEYKKELAATQYSAEQQEAIIQTDKLYWQIVSLANKLKLTEKYVELLRTMSDNVEKMASQGLATQSDRLSVRVKLNEAETTLLKVQNGLTLSKMLLCQNCGLDLKTNLVLADETLEDVVIPNEHYVYSEAEIMVNRPELKSLNLATQIYDKNVALTRSDYLPTIAAFGNYILSNPSSENGFTNEFNGFWNVGIMAKIPILQWGEGANKIQKAKTDARIAQYKLDDAKQKIMLQVNQYEFQINEAQSRLSMANEKMSDAEENLRIATLGFDEGVIASSVLNEAQTAWLQSHSDYIDAKIDWIMANVYLQKAIGVLNK